MEEPCDSKCSEYERKHEKSIPSSVSVTQDDAGRSTESDFHLLTLVNASIAHTNSLI